MCFQIAHQFIALSGLVDLTSDDFFGTGVDYLGNCLEKPKSFEIKAFQGSLFGTVPSVPSCHIWELPPTSSSAPSRRRAG